MNSKHRKTLDEIFAVPVNGSLEWVRIESLLVALGCKVHEGRGATVSFHKDGHVLNIHRPHPGKESLRYRIVEARGFLEDIGATP